MGFNFGWIDEIPTLFANKKTVKRNTKQNEKISKENYEIVKLAILDILKKEKNITNIKLKKSVEGKLFKRFGKEAQWYYLIVRQDLQERGIIEYNSSMSPHRVFLKTH